MDISENTRMPHAANRPYVMQASYRGYNEKKLKRRRHQRRIYVMHLRIPDDLLLIIENMDDSKQMFLELQG